jgi:hypothetical protein
LSAAMEMMNFTGKGIFYLVEYGNGDLCLV